MEKKDQGELLNRSLIMFIYLFRIFIKDICLKKLEIPIFGDIYILMVDCLRWNIIFW